MQKRNRSRVDCFIVPLEPEAEEVLSLWENGHRAESTQLVMRFAKLHYAINAQKRPEAEVLKQLLAQWEDAMLEDYLDLAQTLVPRIQDGYGGPTTIKGYYEGIASLPIHTEKYRQLRNMFVAFLDT